MEGDRNALNRVGAEDILDASVAGGKRGDVVTYEKRLQDRMFQHKVGVSDHLYKVVVGGLWFFVGVYVLLVCVWLWHLLTPDSWNFMTDANLSMVVTLLEGGGIGAVGAGIWQLARNFFGIR